MKRKAIIFPYHAACGPIIRNRELLVNHDIIACVSPIGYGLLGKDAAFAYGGENTEMIITENGISEMDFDDLFLCESASDFDTIVMPQIEIAASRGKNVIFLYETDALYRKKAEDICAEYNVKCSVLTYRTMDISKLAPDENEILRISVPVIFIASVIENTNKFDVQLGLRNYLQKEGYTVSQIGTKQYCELFDFMQYPNLCLPTKSARRKKSCYSTEFVKVSNGRRSRTFFSSVYRGLLWYSMMR